MLSGNLRVLLWPGTHNDFLVWINIYIPKKVKIGVGLEVFKNLDYI